MEAKLTAEEESALFVPAEQDLQAAENGRILQLFLLAEHVPGLFEEPGGGFPAGGHGRPAPLHGGAALPARAAGPQRDLRQRRDGPSPPERRPQRGVLVRHQLHRAGPVGPDLVGHPHQPLHRLRGGGGGGPGRYPGRDALGLRPEAGVHLHRALQHPGQPPPDPGAGPLLPDPHPQHPDHDHGYVYDGVDPDGPLRPQPDRHPPGPGLQPGLPVPGHLHPRILFRNLLPYLVSVIMLRVALAIPTAIGNEVFITYIGLGLPLEIPPWATSSTRAGC